MKKILIAENKEQADQHISQLESIAQGINELVREYNSIEALESLETREDIKSFLENPAEYFNEAVLGAVEIKAKAKLHPHAIAGIIGVPYDKVMRLIGQTNRSGLEHLRWNDETSCIEFDPESEKHIRESFKEYCHPDEAKMYERISGLCDELNSLANYFNLYPHDLNTACTGLGFLKAVVKEDGQGWEFRPEIKVIRSMIEYKKIHEK